MELTEAQYERIAPLLPTQRGNVKLTNLQVLNGILHVAEHGCKWRGLPKRFGNWHTVFMRMNRWSKNGVLDRVFEHLQRERLIRVNVEAMGLDSTSVKVHPDGTGAEKKRPASHRKVVWRLDHQNSSGFRGCPDGHRLLALPGSGARRAAGPKAPERNGGAAVRQPDAGDGPRVRGRQNSPAGLGPGLRAGRSAEEQPRRTLDREMYKRRNETERLFRRLKGFRRIFSRFEKLDVMFLGFLVFVLIVDTLR